MSFVASFHSAVRAKSLALAAVGALVAGAGIPAAAEAQEIVINIARVRALDVIDAASKADFLARVTIDGQSFTTPVIKNQDDIRPNWTISKRVTPGVHDVRVEILDKDVTKNEVIDINRVNGKRDLEFKVDTRRCVVLGFQQALRCRSLIQRAGAEPKKAEISFTVDVRR